MAFGGLAGITAQEALRRYGATPAQLPWGVANFHPSQLSPNLTGPAIVPGIGGLNPTMAQQSLMPPSAAQFFPPQMSLLDFDRAQGMGQPLPTRVPGATAESFGPIAPSRSAVAAAQAQQARLMGVNGPGSMPMGAGQLGGELPYAGQAAAASEIPPSMWLRQARGPGGQMLPRVPPQIITGPAMDVATHAPIGPPAAFAPPVGAEAMPNLTGATLPRTPLALPAGSPPIPAAAAEAGGAMRALPAAAEAAGGVGAAATAAAPAAEAAAAQVARAGGIRGAMSVPGEGSGLAGTGLRGAGGTILRRAIPGYFAYQGLHAAANAAGGDDSILGQALEGGAVAGGIGTTLGGPVAGGVAGLVGAVANPVVSAITGGRSFTESLSNLIGGEGKSAEDAIGEQFADNPEVASILTDRFQRLRDGADNMWEGVPPDKVEEISARFNEAANGVSDDATLIPLQVQLAIDAETAAETAAQEEAQSQQQAPTQLTPADLAATQALATQMVAPIAADSVAIGNMGQAAIQNLAQGLPREFRGPVAALAQNMGSGGEQMANAYMQQAYTMPQAYVMDQQQQMQNQIASMLQQQAIQSLPQFATTGGSTSFDDILAGQALGGGGTDQTAQDMAALIAQG